MWRFTYTHCFVYVYDLLFFTSSSFSISHFMIAADLLSWSLCLLYSLCGLTKWLLDIKKSIETRLMPPLPMTLHLFYLFYGICTSRDWHELVCASVWLLSKTGNNKYQSEQQQQQQHWKKHWIKERKKEIHKWFYAYSNLCGSNERNNWNVTSVRQQVIAAQDMVSVDIQNNTNTIKRRNKRTQHTHSKNTKRSHLSIRSIYVVQVYIWLFFCFSFLFKMCMSLDMFLYFSRCKVSANGKNPSPIDSIKIDAIHTSDNLKSKAFLLVSLLLLLLPTVFSCVVVTLQCYSLFLRHSTHSRFHDCAVRCSFFFLFSFFSIYPTFKRENYYYYKTKPQLNACIFAYRYVLNEENCAIHSGIFFLMNILNSSWFVYSFALGWHLIYWPVRQCIN